MLALLRYLSLRHLADHPLRSFLTILGVSVGVSTMVGVTAINGAVMDAFRSTIDTIAGKADLSISGGVSGFDEAQLEKVKAVPGVLHTSGAMTAVAAVQGMPGERLFVMGVDLLDDGYFRDLKGIDKDVGGLADDLEFLNSTDRMMVSERFAREHGLKTGDTFALSTAQGVQPFTIHGLLQETGPIKAFGGSVGVMFLGSAQAAFGRDRSLDRIDLALAPGADVATVKALLEAALGPAFEIDRPSRRGQSVEKMVRSFQLGLNLGSGVALLVGVFLVYNTVAIGVIQRRREIGTLRALGATRLRIRALFTLEAGVIGLFGTGLGIPLGVLVARLAIAHVSEAISSIYIQVNAKDVTVGALEMALGAGLGIFGSMFAALRPAIVASAVAPVEALRRDIAAGADMAKVASWPTFLGLTLFALVWPCSLLPPPMENLPLGGYLGMFFCLMGATLLSPLVLRALQRAYQGPGQAVFGIAGRLAADNFSRAPVRTAVPVSALAIGVAMTVCIAGFVGSFQASSEKWIDQSVPADLFVTSSAKVAGIQNTPMQPELADALTHVEGVSNANRIRLYAHDVLGLRVFIVSLDPEVYSLRGKPTILAGSLPTEAQRAQGYVTISENLARRRDLKPGSTFPVSSPTGLLTYTVAAVITDYSSDQGAIFVDRRYFTAQFHDALVDTVHLYVDDLSRLESVRQAITAQYGAKYDLYVLSNAELRKEAYDLVGNAFSVTYAMELVAVVLALLGVINTLLAAVLDRTREIGLLRAIGADKRHVLKLFTGEAAFIGLTGSAIGVLVGIALGILVTKVVGVQATGWNFPYLVPWKLALQMGAGATVCAILAGLYPARRAAGLDVVEALAYE